MTLSSDERRALAFVALVLLLSGGARLARRPPDVRLEAAAADLDSLTAASRAARESERARSRPLAPGETVDPNRATEAELDRLPGIGPAVAERIVAARDSGAVFRSPEDLTRVKGIGPKTAARTAPHLDFSRVPWTPPSARKEEEGGKVDVNRASSEELTALPGIGPALAERIVAHRDSAGPFRRPEDLERVRGIGPALRKRLAPRVVF